MADLGHELQAERGGAEPAPPDMGGLVGVLSALAQLRQAESDFAAAQAAYSERLLAGIETGECRAAPSSADASWPTWLVGYSDLGIPVVELRSGTAAGTVSRAAPFEAEQTGIRHIPTPGREETTITFSRTADPKELEAEVPENIRTRGADWNWRRELRVGEHLFGSLAIVPPAGAPGSAPSWLGGKAVAEAAPPAAAESPGGLAGTGRGPIH